MPDYKTHIELIESLNQPLADALKSLDAGYWLVAEAEDDEYVYFEFEATDSPKIEIKIEKVFVYHCDNCGHEFNETSEQENNEGNKQNCCPNCYSFEIYDKRMCV